MENKQKKIYRKLDTSPISYAIDSDSLSKVKPQKNGSQKKIIPTSAISGVREDLKKIFLPLLIDIFELRQMVENYKTHHTSSDFFPIGKISKSPKEILERLEQLQNDIEESKRWCSGVILQVEKGIEEAKEVLALIEGAVPVPPAAEEAKEIKTPRSFFHRLFVRKKK